MDEGERPVGSDAVRRKLRDQAGLIHRRAVTLAAAGTALLLAAPPY